MRNTTQLFLLIAIFILALNGCGPSPSPTVTPVAPFTPSSIPPTLASSTSTPTRTPIPKGETIVVTSTADSGPGTLRQALLDAKPGDIVTFDPKVFPPDKPATILLNNVDQDSALPTISQGDLTIDASNAGVILDGQNLLGYSVNGLEIYSDVNTVEGLQIINFPGVGIIICSGSYNRIGGDRKIGTGPLGQSNLVSNNNYGIGLCGNGTKFNSIVGNLIGTDPTGTYKLPVNDFWINNDWGNRYDGIWIENDVSQNTIGPDNIIAFNRYNGIRMNGESANGNTISQNSIHDNAGAGIQLSSGSNGRLTAPTISDFDLNAGTVTGTACANCLVEIYSDENSEGEVFEGQTTTDETGFFAFNNSVPFTKSRVTAAATDAKGSTSQFSKSIGIATILQKGNDQPRVQIHPGSSGELADNRIGSQWHSLYFVTEFELQEMLDENLAMGVRRFRLSINNSDSENVSLFWDNQEFYIAPEYDEFITELANNGVRVTFLLSFWDKAYRNEGGSLTHPRFQTEDQIQRYLDYVKFIVNHFKDHVLYYEIWNEPTYRDTLQWIKVEDYINLVKRTVPVIRQEQPEAKIVVGSIPSLNESDDRDYLLTILKSDIMPMVDVVAWHPLYGTSPEYDSDMRQYYYEYPSIVQDIKDSAFVHGFRGEFVADELLWRPPETALFGDPWSGASDEIKAAKYMARGIVINLGMDVSVTQQDTGNYRRPPLVFYTIQNLATTMAGNKPISFPVTIQSEAIKIKSYGFSLPNGDNLFALWNDGVTVDYDPGISATLVFPGRADQKAVCIAVLNGFEQQLITDVEGDNLVIRDFLIQDYPLIIRFTGTTSP